ncbi:hypothetical protein PAXRUDRAFT_657724 [Paxillus rubicundulus Ve08.2h10]|uniref:Uncharacterized protein n=1 Tax=Paxillus rubicundulus Ve08.2h10 TaxID=930991 RepID=A0A0D0C958_9AGAM|nr:hypothetical protein PAXRUDRAFT_657724 [Paxillus rubicundulus Ve08.2h10]
MWPPQITQRGSISWLSLCSPHLAEINYTILTVGLQLVREWNPIKFGSNVCGVVGAPRGWGVPKLDGTLSIRCFTLHTSSPHCDTSFLRLSTTMSSFNVTAAKIVLCTTLDSTCSFSFVTKSPSTPHGFATTRSQHRTGCIRRTLSKK